MAINISRGGKVAGGIRKSCSGIRGIISAAKVPEPYRQYITDELVHIETVIASCDVSPLSCQLREEKMKTDESIYDEIIKAAINKYFPELVENINNDAWLWIKAQIWQESRFDTLAKSPVGAQGLMQIMPSTAAYMGYTDPFDPTHNINGGVSYLAKQYRHLSEIPDHSERVRFALASYNGGRGYINRALELARATLGFPASYAAWKSSGMPAGDWQHWHYTKVDLRRPECTVHGHRPDFSQIDGYVTKIEARYFFYLSQKIEQEAA